jgi:hypothetical protein
MMPKKKIETYEEKRFVALLFREHWPNIVSQVPVLFLVGKKASQDGERKKKENCTQI